MATTKTLTPTNQAITLAAFTEKPDNRTNVTNDDKLADAVNALNSNTAYNTQNFSNLADFKTFLDNMTVGKTSSLLLSGEASNAICGSTYICCCKVYKIDNNFADIVWIRGNTQIGSARYQKTQGTFIINDINSNVNTIKEITNYTLASGIDAENLHIYQVGKIVIISGGVSSKGSSTVSFTNGQALLTGLPAPNDARRIFMGLTFESGTRNQYRLQAVSGDIQAFWDTVVVPATGYGLYLNVVYTTNQ